MNKDYTIGLDIGTASVGWAVLDPNYDLIKKNMRIQGNGLRKQSKKNFWGVRLFEAGETAEGTRMKRTTRRRYTRRRNRIRYLQGIFQAEIAAADKNFFYRLEDSFLVPEEKRNERHPIFATLDEEVAYHKQIPTIYHLRKYLADSAEQADLRLVYLALAHIIKFRGNFLIEGKLNTENSSVEETFKNFVRVYNQTFKNPENSSESIDETLDVSTILQKRLSRQKKAETILKLFPKEKSTGSFMQFLKMIVGNQGSFKKTFDLDEEFKMQFSKDEYEEQLEGLLGLIGDDYAEVFAAAKTVYDAVELSGILTVKDLSTKAKLSASLVQRYDEHKADLETFKKFIRTELPDKYFEVFRDEQKNGYAGYIEKGTTQADFYKYVENLLKNVEGADYFLDKVRKEDFLRKQRTFDNGVIPHQIHLEELRAIINKQSRYYPFLAENKTKIEQILTFRIPYYVGPLAKGNSRFAWLSRKKDDAITPWNFAEVIDKGKSATAFIERMTNYDSYLPQEKVLPKHSMLYEKYTVFNELTKVSYIDDRGEVQNFSSVEKQEIFRELFKKNRKVNKSLLEKFLKNHYMIETAEIRGIEQRFNASYGTYHDLIKLGVDQKMLDDPKNEELFEEIVKILTVFEDQKMIKEQLSNFEPYFDQAVLKKLARRHYTGWGRLSAKLINGIRDKQSKKTILDYLMRDDDFPRNKNRNLMQLINDENLSFKEIIEKEQSVDQSADLYEVVGELAGSPAIKKGIFQSLKIVDEIVGIMGYPPKNIVVEMARENQTTTAGRNKSRARQKVLEDAMKELGSNILKEYPLEGANLRNDRLFLYYLQNGKDMYTGNELDINKLAYYDIDHIIPQSFIKDNSIDNMVLVSSKANRGKSNDVPSSDVVRKMINYWEKLKTANLISQRKFDNLTKGISGGLTEADKAHFIKRQLVETRQITKHIARILHQKYNTDENRPTRVITLKSALTSQFRQIYKLYKVREVNDYHHAHDAYLNGVVAQALLKVYPKLEPEFVYGDYQKFNLFKENKATAKKNFYSNLMLFFEKDQPRVDENGEILWDQKHISMVKKVMSYRQMNIVKKTEIQTGGFSKESIQAKGNSSKLIARKKGWDPKKYGGFDSPNIAYSVVITHEKGKSQKITKDIVGITIMEHKNFEENAQKFLTEKGYINPQVVAKLPKYALYELENGRRRLIASATEAQKGNQMVLPNHLVELLYHAKHYEDLNGESLKYLIEHRELFDELFETVKQFAAIYTLADKNLGILENLFEENQDADIKLTAQSFLNLMQFNAMGAPAEFKFFDTAIPRKRYTSTKELLTATIINQSITGLYETHWKLGE
ncbi:type II CRISPR RNA-guided endonuclease Cas9 [Enterococcus xiangfangensis]|uniref:CRISPR-associated endonuclease Cas9 n=1 Tax=Enterococcus xiangfangensis TaxID=1296537 RepID=A0ABU3F8G1_9ENTE|nr:type II CRISPR RNA-guided endonuclease Cas9 [Enterococcus xiangfangensis]MDT2758952.1 type II CRISPR RNA-guided endonuclease Cas9 [Enterococcus xiangfangensis]